MTMPTNIGQNAFESPPLNDARHGSSSSGDTRPNTRLLHSLDDYQDNGREFGMGYNATNSWTGDKSKSLPIERTESGSSLVVAMRKRFSNPVRHLCFFILCKQLFIVIDFAANVGGDQGGK
jgi:hypothetical protein